MKTSESTAVWVVNNTVKWSITSEVLQSSAGAVKIAIANNEKDSTDEFPLPPDERGAFHYDFEKDKHYSVRLIIDEREYALTTL